ncbi:MAG: putative DNA binding domain-containing protein [Thermoplasmata archaeon]|nr:putative DNA binding domain-containing protein [Thermoplasmata archaeon]
MNNNEVVRLIKGGENEFVEFKKSFSDEVIKTLVAFSNARGGRVFIGITDKGEIKGTSVKTESVQKWLNEIKNKTYPFITPDVEEIEVDGKKILIFEVMEFPIKPVSFKGRYYLRTRNRNSLMNLNDVAEMYLRTKNTSWDFFPDKKKELDDLDEEKILGVKGMIEKNLETDAGDILSFLRKYSLIIEEGGKQYPTFAALLLFSKEPLRMTDIQIGLFQDDVTIKKSKIIRTDLISEVEEVMDFIKAYILKEYVFTGSPQREERWQYPINALREFVINAIVHRDYRGVHSQFRVFPDKIDLWNDGKLPPELTIEDLKKGIKRSYPRNKLIAEVFRDSRLIERYGSGVARAIKEFVEYDLPEPVIREEITGIEVTINGTKVKNGMGKTIQESPINYPINHPETTLKRPKKVPKTTREITGEIENVPEMSLKPPRKIPKTTREITDEIENVPEMSLKCPEKVPKKRQALILEKIQEGPEITIPELASYLSVNEKTIKRDLAILKKKGIIKRVGSRRGGHWEVV